MNSRALLGLSCLLLLTGCGTMDAVTGKKTYNFYSIHIIPGRTKTRRMPSA